jgi:hypothetical protein
MPRVFVSSLLVLLIFSSVRAYGHDGHGDGGESSDYYAFIDDFHANPSLTDATGEVFLTLNAERTELSYKIVLSDLLGFKENPAERIEPDDIIGIHLHLHVPDTVGPHVLNIFGLATYNVPAEEDADRVIDYENRTISGVWDNGDATLDPATGEPYLQFFPLTSKLLTDWIDELNGGELMLAIHTNESGFPTMAIHGHIQPVIDQVPEPSSALCAGGIALASLCSRRRRLRAARNYC